MTNTTTRTRIGLALAVVLAGLGGAARAQEAPATDFNDLMPPDMGAPPGDREYRTCPDREDRPEWAENLEGWETGRSALLSEIYKARTYEAIAAARVGTYDLILMDMRMPGMSGEDAARALRAMGVATPIVALTANAFDEDRRRCLAAGMDDFLVKPLSPDALRAMLTCWARRGWTKPAAQAKLA